MSCGVFLPHHRPREIRRVLRDRYGRALPDDDAGREDMAILLRHVAHLHDGYRRMENYIEVYAPWLVDGERVNFLNAALCSTPPAFTADEIAIQLNVTLETRQALGLTTIGAVDCDKEERQARRKALGRLRKARRRRKTGCKMRAEYLATSLSEKQPWLAEGISRRTWYRRQKGSGE
jgi:hypothetical protein